jgi:hypothetical protein
MLTCPHCGHQSTDPTPFCAHCGARVEAPAAAPVADDPTGPIRAQHRPPEPAADVVSSTRTLPPPSPAASTTAAHPEVDWMRLLRGNWLGAALVAGVTLATAGGLAVVLTAMAKPTDFGLRNSLTLVATVLDGSFGADLVAHVHVAGESVDASLGAVPFTVTLIALFAGTLTFRAVTSGYRRLSDAVADAARAALLLGLALMVVALVFRADSRQFGRGWGSQVAGLFDARISFGASVPGALFLGFLLLFVTLLGSLWVRRDLWPARFAGLGDVLVPAVHGLTTFVLLLPVAGLVGLVLMLLTGDTVQNSDPTRHDFLASAALIFGLLASGGYWLVTLGAGGTFGSHSHTSGELSTSDYDHLGYFAGQDHGLWAAPLVMVAVIGLATVVVARRTRSPELLQASLLTWVGLLLLATPFLVRLTSVHGGVHASDGSATGAIGVNGWWAALLLPLAALVCSAAVAASRHALDLSALRDLGRRIQRNPAREP